MKSNYWLLTVIFALVALPGKAGEWIRINQLGYLPQSVKVAVFMSEEGTNVENYSLIDAFTGKVRFVLFRLSSIMNLVTTY